MKFRNLTVDFIMTLDEDNLREAGWVCRPVSTCVRKSLKRLEGKPITSDRQAKELASTRNVSAKVSALLEAIMCRQDELYGPGVLSSYDHTERFV